MVIQNLNNKPCTACSEIGAPSILSEDIRLVKIMPEGIDIYHKKAQWVCKEHRSGFSEDGYKVIFI